MKIKFPKFIKSKKIVAMLLILVAIAVTIFIVSKNRAKNVVDRATIQKGEVAQELILSGEIVATEHAQLVFPASGEIAWVNVKEGDWVKKGTALTSLNKTVLAATYQQALNNVRRYEANVDYVHDSLKDKDSTETFAEIDTRTTAEVAKDNAYDALRIAEYNLRNATLTAPFEGLVTYVAHPYSGVNVSFTETQIELINPSTSSWIRFQIEHSKEMFLISASHQSKMRWDLFMK